MAEGGDSCSGMGRGRGLRYGSPVQRQPLKKPVSDLSSNRENTGSANSVDSTHLNASAVSGKYMCGVNDVTDKVPDKKPFELSAAAPEFVPRSCLTIAMPNKARKQEEEPAEDASNSTDMEFILEQLNLMMDEMASNPAKFDLIANSILEMLTSSASISPVLTSIVNSIFDRSVVESNLRYNGARLCNYLSQNVLTEASEKAFRTVLIQRCQSEYSRRMEYVQDAESINWLHGLTHFFGELFIHLEVGASSAGQTSRVNVLRPCLCEMLGLLLEHPNDSNFKCVAQVLKFAGAVIEDEQQLADNYGHLDKLMQKIKEVTSVDHQNVKIHIREMLQKIVELRASNWGRTASSPVHREEQFMGDVPYNPALQGDAVLYGPDGQPLTVEESAFLESDQYLYDGEEDYGDYQEYGQGEVWSTGDDQMDDEMAAAYEEFLAQQKFNGPHHRP